MADDSQASIEELRERILESMRKMRSQSLSLDEAEALGELIEGRKTAVELAEAIYGVGKEDPGHDSSCRIRELGLEDHVTVTGFLPHAEVLKRCSHADVLALQGLLEGILRALDDRKTPNCVARMDAFQQKLDQLGVTVKEPANSTCFAFILIAFLFVPRAIAKMRPQAVC